jgi:hypothetical protein
MWAFFLNNKLRNDEKRFFCCWIYNGFSVWVYQ